MINRNKKEIVEIVHGAVPLTEVRRGGYTTGEVGDIHRSAGFLKRTQRAQFLADGQYIYLCGGSFYGGTLTTGIYYDDILRYEAAKDEWVRLGHLPDDARENMISWVIDGTLYTGLGNDKRNTPCAQLYRVRL